ncbi:hypothetical protein [Dysgonomonas reticulitermitis]
MDNERMSIRKFAKLIDLSEGAVRKAINIGKIKDGVDNSGNRPMIIPSIARKEVEDLGIGLKSKGSFLKNGLDLSNLTDEERKNIEVLTVDTATFKESKRREAYYMSELARLEFEEKNGTLVKKDEVYKELFDFGSEIKSRILSIPDRITDELISLSDDRTAFYNLFYKNQRDALEILSKSDTVLDK